MKAIDYRINTKEIKHALENNENPYLICSQATWDVLCKSKDFKQLTIEIHFNFAMDNNMFFGVFEVR